MSWSDVKGHEVLVTILRKALDSGQLPLKMVFLGPHGVGKTFCASQIAEQLSAELVVESGDDFTFSNSGVTVVENPHLLSEKDVWNLNHAELDFPLIIEAEGSDKLPQDLGPSFVTFRFSPLSLDVLTDFALKLNPELGSPVAKQIATLSQGSWSRVEGLVKTHSLWHEAFHTANAGERVFTEILRGDSVRTFQLVDQIIAMGVSRGELFEALLGIIRDLFIAKTPGNASPLSSLASQLSSDQVFLCAKTLWDLQIKVRDNVDSIFDLAVIMLLSLFRKTELVRPTEPSRLTLDEMRSF